MKCLEEKKKKKREEEAEWLQERVAEHTMQAGSSRLFPQM